MKASVQVITPEKAKQLLEANTGNRSLNKSTITRYRNDMILGRWRPNGSSISIGPDGRLLNGQHRLTALVEAEVPIEFVIVEEDTDAVFTTLDIGVNRSTGTLLNLAGIHNSNVVGAVARAILAYENAPTQVWDTNAAGGRTAVIDWVMENNSPLLQSAAHQSADARRAVPAIGSWYGALSYLVQTKSAHADRWIDFHNAIIFGANLSAGDPRLALRNWVINRGAPQSEWDRQQALGAGLHAWNTWVAGEERTFIKFSRASLPMPTIS
jgi:hypothetical protein